MNREWIRKEVLARKESRRSSWAAAGQEASISGQTASRVEHDQENISVTTWRRLMAWVQEPNTRPNAPENLRAFTGLRS